MQRGPGWLTAMTGALALLATHSALAQTARSGGNASAQLMQQMQQLASERTTLQAENDKLKKQLADLTKDRDALKAGQQAVDRRAKESAAALQNSKTQREVADKELTQTKAKMQELVAKFRETLTKMRDMETENTATKQALATRERELSTCADHNAGLYKLNDEILARMDKKPNNLFSCMESAEPFTQIKRARNENLVDGYRNRAQDQIVTPPAGLPSASAAAAPPAPSTAAPPASPTAAPGSAIPHAAGAEQNASKPASPPHQ